MAKLFRCQIMNWDGDFTARGETETAVLWQVLAHLPEKHRLLSFRKDPESKVRSAIHGYREDGCPLCR